MLAWNEQGKAGVTLCALNDINMTDYDRYSGALKCGARSIKAFGFSNRGYFEILFHNILIKQNLGNKTEIANFLIIRGVTGCNKEVFAPWHVD